MSGWPYKPFDEVLTDESGGNLKTLQSEFLMSGRFPIIDQGKELIAGYTDDESRLCRATLPVIIFGDHTRCFKYVDFPFCMGADGVKVLKPKVDADVKYLYHYLRHLRLPEGGYARHFKYLKRNSILFPPLSQQRRIAEILDKADALRAKRRAALVQLDTLTQSIFLEMFGDPHQNPRGWPTRRLDSTCELVNGRAFKPKEWEQVGLPIIRIQNLNDPTKPFNYTTKELPERFRVRSGDILFSWSGTPGTSFGCLRWNGPNGWLNQHIFNVKLNGSLDGEFFIEHVSLKMGELIAKAHGGVGLQHVTKGMVDGTMLMMPPKELQVEFSRRIKAVEMLKRRVKEAQVKNEALFTSLQHRAFRGELSIHESYEFIA